MPRVAPYERTVAPRPGWRANMTTQASPNAFGAQIGDALGRMGQAVANVGDILDTVQDREDEAAAKQAETKYRESLRNLMYDPTSGYAYTEGKNALDQRQAVEQAADRARAEALDGLNPRARRYAEQAVESSRQGFLQSTAQKAGTERKTYIQQASASRLASFADDATAGFADPKMVARSIAAGKAELQQQAEDNGWDPDTLKLKSEEFESGVLKNVILQTAAEDPLRAAQMVEDNRKRLTGAHAYDLDNSLRDAVKNERSKQAADAILGEIIGGGGAGEGGAVQPVNVVEGIGIGQAKNLLRSKEGFRATPYWDVNAYRVGFGSDTITRADGTVERVRQGMTVTRADAERDLTRRIQEFQGGIVRMVGADKWAALPSNAQAALTSIAYNYGSLPFSVANAVVRGDTNAIATAVEGLAGHNGGINRKRRLYEASLIRGGEAVPIVPAAGGGGAGGSMFVPGMIDYAGIEARLQAIEDPEVRDLARKRVNALIDAQEKAQEQTVKAAKAELWRGLETGDYKTPDDAPLDVRVAAGQEAVSSAWTYVEKRQQQGEIVSDEALFYALRQQQAADPDGFTRVDLNDYRDQLAKDDIRKLVDLQTSAITDKNKARQEATVTKSVMDYAETQLSALGITTVGTDGTDRQEAAKRIARFNDALQVMVEEFEATNNRKPGFEEQQAMVNQLLMPVIFRTPGAWGADDEDGFFAFESRFAPDGTTIVPNVDYADIPVDVRAMIASQLETTLGRRPTPEEIAAEYAAALQGR